MFKPGDRVRSMTPEELEATGWVRRSTSTWYRLNSGPGRDDQILQERELHYHDVTVGEVLLSDNSPHRHQIELLDSDGEMISCGSWANTFVLLQPRHLIESLLGD